MTDRIDAATPDLGANVTPPPDPQPRPGQDPPVLMGASRVMRRRRRASGG